MLERDIQVRYRQSLVGVAWAVLQPATMMVIFTIFFGRLAKIPTDGVPYPVFVFAGLLPWIFFSSAASAASQSLVGQAGLVSKVYFPRLLLPVCSMGAFVVDFAAACTLLIALMFYYGYWPGPALLLVPLLLLGVAMVTAAIGIFFSALVVNYRDVRYVLPFVLQIWMFVTPVIYPPSFLAEEWRWLLWLNPLAGFIDGIRGALLSVPFDLIGVAVSCGLTVLLLLGATMYFRSVERRLADLI